MARANLDPHPARIGLTDQIPLPKRGFPSEFLASVSVIPAKAGTQNPVAGKYAFAANGLWIPAFAGMTVNMTTLPRNPVAFIEAKRLSEPLEKPNTQDQVFTYALVQQVKYAGLTDGNRWILDNVSVFSGERRVLDISLSETPTHEAALKLLLLWRPNLASGQPVEANAPELVGVRPLQHSTTTVAQETGQNNPGNWIFAIECCSRNGPETSQGN